MCYRLKHTISIVQPLVETRHPAGVPTHDAFFPLYCQVLSHHPWDVFCGVGTLPHLSSTILLPMSSFCKEFKVVLHMLHVSFRCFMFTSANVMHDGAAAGINQSSQSFLSAFFFWTIHLPTARSDVGSKLKKNLVLPSNGMAKALAPPPL